MSRLKIRIAVLFAAAVPLTAAYLGGWATVTVENLPDSIVAGQPTNLTFSVRQHGEDLLGGLKPTVTGVSGKHEFTGRAVAALAADPDVLRHSGKVLVAASVARDYGFTDIDGTTPRPLTLADV